MSDIISILKKVGAILEGGHFVGTSGRHFPVYLNKDVLYTHPEATSDVGKLFAEKYVGKGIQVVVGPAMGGVILAQWTAYHLGKLGGRQVSAAFADKDDDEGFVLKRGYDGLIEGKKVLLVEDITTTGGSIKKVAEAVEATGADVVDVCVMVNRDPGNVTAEKLGFPFSSLSEYEVPSYEDKDCPLCAENTPINTEVGHGKQFLEDRQ